MKKRINTEKDLKRSGLRTDQHGVQIRRFFRVTFRVALAVLGGWLAYVSFRAFALGLGGIGPAIVVCIFGFPFLVWTLSLLYSVLSFIRAFIHYLFS